MIQFKKNHLNLGTFDFNKLFDVLDSDELSSTFTTKLINDYYILETPIRIKNVEQSRFFKKIYEDLNIEYNKHNRVSNIFLFVSFASGGKGMPHKDIETVHLIGLHGKTMYIIGDEHYILEKGDLLIIPKGVPHRAIGLSPRIVLSFGIY